MDRVVLIMAKQPIAGSSKTRLTPVLSDEDAAELSACFIADAATAMLGLADDDPNLRVAIAGTPASSEGYFAELVPAAGFVAQRGPSLGHRLANVMTDTLDDGAAMVVAINSDSPTLPPALIADAFDRLADDDVDVVLGPAEDGGYHLIGWKRPHPRMVIDVEMSTPDVLTDTLVIAEDDGVRVALTEPWFDVDQPADLDRVRADLDAGRFCGPATTAFFLTRPDLGTGSRTAR